MWCPILITQGGHENIGVENESIFHITDNIIYDVVGQVEYGQQANDEFEGQASFDYENGNHVWKRNWKYLRLRLDP